MTFWVNFLHWKRIVAALVVASILAGPAVAADFVLKGPSLPPPNGRDMPTLSIRITDHAYVLQGFPKVGIVVGKNATLVVDTGLGTKNGAIVAKEARRRAGRNLIYLTTTSYMPENAMGDQGFPSSTKIIRCNAQQQELDTDGPAALAKYRQNPAYAAVLQNVRWRKADILFDNEYTLDLGDVHVRLMCLGTARTKGDLEAFVDEDRALFTGAVLRRDLSPDFLPQSSPKGWLATIDKLALLHPYITIGSEGELHDYKLPRENKLFMEDLVARALQLKADGQSAERAGKTLQSELQKKYPGWKVGDLSVAAARIYAEAQ